MHLRLRFASVSLAALFAACSSGGGGGSGAPNPPLQTGTTVSVTFLGALPNAAAVSTASGIFVSATLSGNKLAFVVPAGTNTYAFAVACPAVNVSGTLIAESVVDANLSDGTAYTVAPCLTPAAATGAATGTYDISAIPGAVRARIVGALGFSGDVNGITGTFNVSMPVGTNDVAVLALDGFGNILAVRMLRAQNVPGALNAGVPIVVGIGDEVTNEAVTLAGVPRGFAAPALTVRYLTANATVLALDNGSAFTYTALSPGDASAFDQYQIKTTAASVSINEAMGATLFTSTGTAVTLTFPPVWSYTPPAAAQFPTFSFVYSGFIGLAMQTYRGQIAWQSRSANTIDQITAYATAAYVGTQTSIAIPNLSALPGFFGSAASGVAVNWLSQIDGGSFPSYVYPPPMPGSQSFVQAHGTYIEP